MKKVGILGGTFNPIHNGHLVIAEQVLTQKKLDSVLFLPDFKPPHVDSKAAIAADLRVEMVKLAIAGNQRFGLEMAEINRKGVSYTIDTIKTLKQKHPDVDYSFIIGGDMVDYLPKWHQIDQLVKMVDFIGVNRPHSKAATNFPISFVKVPEIGISSTLIRNLRNKGDSIRYLVPNPVNDFIKEHNLYE